MKFKLDENLPASATAVLAKRGHDVDTVPDEGLTGAPDPRVVAVATAEGRVLITLDRGLGDIRAYPPGSRAGIIVLRLSDQSAPAVTEAISELADGAELEALAGAVSVLQRFSAIWIASSKEIPVVLNWAVERPPTAGRTAGKYSNLPGRQRSRADAAGR